MRRISDEELFGGVSLPVPVQESSALKKAKIVLEALSAAGLQVPFGMNLDSAEQLWAGELAQFTDVDLSDAVEAWIGGTDPSFPSVGQIAHLARDAYHRRMAEPQGPCRTCDGSRYLEVADDTGRITGMQPCPECNESQYTWVRDGHSSWRHTRVTCDHPICIAKSRRERKPRKR